VIALLVLLALIMPVSYAGAAPDLTQFAFQQRPGSQLSLDALFRDEASRPVRLGSIVGPQPTILALGYFDCPNLCGVVRGDLMDALTRSGLQPNDYTLVLLSIDPSETAADAGRAEQQDVARANLSAAPASWHYLTGNADSVQQVEREVGFRSRFDPQLKQFLHPAGIVFLTPEGTVSSYILGVGYKPGDVRLAVMRARTGSIAQAATPILLLCFHYDATTGRYTLSILKLLEIACILTIATVGGMIALALHRERRS
jgi:protein SCO1